MTPNTGFLIIKEWLAKFIFFPQSSHFHGNECHSYNVPLFAPLSWPPRLLENAIYRWCKCLLPRNSSPFLCPKWEPFVPSQIIFQEHGTYDKRMQSPKSSTQNEFIVLSSIIFNKQGKQKQKEQHPKISTENQFTYIYTYIEFTNFSF